MNNSNGWFKRLGWFYWPVAWPGAVLCVLTFLFCVQVFVAIDRHSHSASDTFYGIFPYFACAFLLLNWVASNTASQGERRSGHRTQTDEPSEGRAIE